MNVNKFVTICILLTALTMQLLVNAAISYSCNDGKINQELPDYELYVSNQNSLYSDFLIDLGFYPIHVFNNTVSVKRYPSKEEYYKYLNDLPWKLSNSVLFENLFTWEVEVDGKHGKLTINLTEDKKIIKNFGLKQLKRTEDLSFIKKTRNLDSTDIYKHFQREFLLNYLEFAHLYYSISKGEIPSSISDIEDMLGVTMRIGETYAKYGFEVRFDQIDPKTNLKFNYIELNIPYLVKEHKNIIKLRDSLTNP